MNLHMKNKKPLTIKNLIITGKNSLAYMESIYNFSSLDIIVEFKVF
jgi:hypothetical protein